MKILLAIPSKNRVETLFKNAFPWVSVMPFDWNIFVEPQDMAAYEAAGFSSLISIEKDNQGLHYAKDFIQRYAKNNGYDLVFKIDDDVRGFTNFRKANKPPETVAQMTRFITETIKLFEKNNDLGAIAFPYRFEMYGLQSWVPTKRVQTAYIVRTEFLHSGKKISVFEDFAVGLQILTKGKKILKFGMYGIDMGVAVGGGTGGHQDLDRSAQAAAEIEILREIYPPLRFRKVEKPWKYEPDLKSVKL